MPDMAGVPDISSGFTQLPFIGGALGDIPGAIIAYANGASSMDQLEVMGLICIGLAFVNIFLSLASISENEAYIRRMSR